MNTPDDIKKGLQCLGSMGIKACSDCVWHGREKRPCREAVTDEAVECIEALEAEREQALKRYGQLYNMESSKYGRACGVCKHKDPVHGGAADSQRCLRCLFSETKENNNYHPLFELEGAI